VGRMVRLAAILVVVLGLLGLLFGRHDAGTAQTIDRAGRLQVLGSDNGDSAASTTNGGPATGGNSRSSSPRGNSNGNASTSPQTSGSGGTGGSGNGAGGTQPKPIVGSTSNRLG